jgi:hypothetical protein
VVLSWTPVDGCTDDAQCTAIRAGQVTFLEESQGATPGTLTPFAWRCQDAVTDPAFRGVGRCVMKCDGAAADQCAPGSVCAVEEGRCVHGPVPDPQCLAALQHYQVNASDAYTVLGSISGYLHRQVADPMTGECVADPLASPLRAGRFGRREPMCTDDGLEAFTPNPCAATLDEPISPDTPGDPAGVRQTQAVRVRLPGLTLEIADVVQALPGQPGELYSPAPPGYRFTFGIAGGFVARDILLDADLPERVRMAPDGTLWVIDSGDQGAVSGRHGQVIHVTSGAQGLDGIRLD